MGGISAQGDSDEWTTVLRRRKKTAKKDGEEGLPSFLFFQSFSCIDSMEETVSLF